MHTYLHAYHESQDYHITEVDQVVNNENPYGEHHLSTSP